jgi:FtsZ-interacting cell division protein YlmF
VPFEKDKTKNPAYNYLNPKTVNEIDNNDKKSEKEATTNNIDEEIIPEIIPDAIPVVETKSKRLNLLIYPSVYEDMQRIAEMKGEKANNLINEILKEYSQTDESKKLIEAHKKIKG